MKDEPEKQTRYHDLGEDYFWLGAQNTLVEEILTPELTRLRSEAPGRPLRFLDLGCGPGNMLRRLERWGVAIGSDFSLEALAFARSKGMARLLSADVTALPFKSASLDALVSLDVLEHVQDDAAGLAEIARALRPGGIFFFAVPAFPALWRHHDALYGHFRRYRRPELIAKINRAGLRVERCHFIKCAFFLPLLAVAALERWGLMAPRDNFYGVPPWVNAALTAEILAEHRLGLTRVLPVGVSLICSGRR